MSRITVGSPSTPCPREDPLAAKKQRLAERQALIAAGRERAKDMPPEDAAKVKAAADRFEGNIKAVERAKLADAVYEPTGAPEGWKRLNDDPQSMPEGLRNLKWEDPSEGFRAAVFQSEIDGSPIVVYRGTANGEGWKNNAQQGLGYQSAQYDNAIHLAQAMNDTYGPGGFETAGHSLGGGLSSAASGVTGAKGTSFNAAGVHPRTLDPYGVSRSDAGALMDHYHVAGEMLTAAQSPVTNVLIAPISAVGTAVRYVRQLNPVSLVQMARGKETFNPYPVVAYPAVGKDHKLPAVDEHGEPVGVFAAGPIDRHGMQYVINGMEKQKSDDQAALQSAAAPLQAR